MSIEAEQAFLGGLMVLCDMSTDLAVDALSLVQPGFFTDEQDSIIYATIQRLAAAGQPVDIVTVSEEVQKTENGHLVELAYLAQLAANTPSAANVLSYGIIIKDKAVKRVIVDNLHKSIALINNPSATGTTADKLNEIEGMINAATEFAQTGKEGELRHISEIAKEWLDDLNEQLESGAPAGFTTGIKDLDTILAPKMIPSGSLVVVGARPKTGKTALLTTIVNHFGVERKEEVAVFSLEMTDKQMSERVIVGVGKFDPAIFYDRTADMSELSKSLGIVRDSKIYINDTPGVSLADIIRQSRKLAKQDGANLKLIAVDYLTLMKTEKAERNDLAYGAITRGLKGLAKELGCVVLLITQLNRQLEQRPNKRPLPSDSRDAGQIEQDADLWVGLFRPSMYEEGEPTDNALLEIIVKLNRHGETGTAMAEVVHGVVQSRASDGWQQ